MGYEFEIQYQPDIENKAADALSRISSLIELSAISIPMIVDVQTILEQLDGDPLLSRIKQELQEEPDLHPKYSLDQGRLLYKGWLVLPRSSLLI